MTLGGRSIAAGALAAFGLLSLCLILLAPEWEHVFEAVPAIALASLIFLRLRAAAYASTAAAGIVVALFAQPDLLASLSRLDGPVWLGLVLYAIAVSGADGFVRTGVRSIIMLGGALAVLQIIDPMGVFLVAAIVPLLVAQPNLRSNSLQAVTLAVLVLFVPIATAVLLHQLGTSHSTMPPLQTLLAGSSLVPLYPIAAPSPFAPLSAVVLLVPPLIVLIVKPALRTAPAIFSAMLGLTIVAAFAASSFVGDHREGYWLSASLFPVSAALLAALKPAAGRERLALAASFLSLAGSWIVWAL